MTEFHTVENLNQNGSIKGWSWRTVENQTGPGLQNQKVSCLQMYKRTSKFWVMNILILILWHKAPPPQTEAIETDPSVFMISGTVFIVLSWPCVSVYIYYYWYDDGYHCYCRVEGILHREVPGVLDSFLYSSLENAEPKLRRLFMNINLIIWSSEVCLKMWVKYWGHMDRLHVNKTTVTCNNGPQHQDVAVNTKVMMSF